MSILGPSPIKNPESSTDVFKLTSINSSVEQGAVNKFNQSDYTQEHNSPGKKDHLTKAQGLSPLRSNFAASNILTKELSE